MLRTLIWDTCFCLFVCLLEPERFLEVREAILLLYKLENITSKLFELRYF